ncbi:AraC family transcriptional regulator [Pseudoxanthomonas sp. JBR18]|uniref:AraC family transcriptional regulator n=1 Tax=Pseudoxanthomonas sp. JBR18 TaxID=2969308 RepID=UPI0023051EA8|nr:AraC family transcriptional regulator [Pseudoxanthomonas sp. JBR18]WCE04840.1 AraC family transcriptional regulator [Pseudoxanthomonas sp. JBR18]
MNTPRARPVSRDWIALRRDRETGIETVQAHFGGHAYDPHDHDELLVGFTQQGVQQFRCRRAVHVSTPGRAILIEPGEVHDGRAPEREGFTYAMLYLPQPVLVQWAERLGQDEARADRAASKHILQHDPGLVSVISGAFSALHAGEGRLARDQTLDALLRALHRHRSRHGPASRPVDAAIVRVREALHAHLAQDIGLDDLSKMTGMDRFRLTRQFTQAYGLSPHAYLIRLRLRAARALLAGGMQPASVAPETGFADQSHLGRWFRRAYRLTPAAYRRSCTNVPDLVP